MVINVDNPVDNQGKTMLVTGVEPVGNTWKKGE